MSTFEVAHLDRDPRTGQLLPGHSVSNTSAKVIAKKMAELKAAYIQAVDPGDSVRVYEEHMKCLLQDKDMKLKLASIALWYDRNFGKATETINVNSEGSNSGTMAAMQHRLDPDDLDQLEKLLAKMNPPAVIDVPAPAVKS
jgi:hypothetical protein